jgi:hypothetical protein
MVALVGALTLWTAPAIAQVTISIDDATASGGTATVTVSLAANGASVGGMQNDIIFDNRFVNLARVQDCAINPAIGLMGEACTDDPSIGPCKNLSRALNNCGDTPLPPGCPGADPNLTRFRGIIAATAVPNNNAIPDGVLYTCTFQVTQTPADLTNANVVVSNPTGTRLDSVGDSGVISGEGGEPTNTPTEGGGEPTPTPTFPTDVVVIDIANNVEVTGGMAAVTVNLIGNGMSVGGMQNDIIFDNRLVQLARVQDCVINPAIGLMGEACQDDPSIGPCKNLSRALNNCGEATLPPGCPSADPNLSRFRGIIAATAVPNNNSIPDGVLYTCTFAVTESAALTNANVVVSNPTGTRLNSFAGDGSIGGGVIPPTEGPTNTPAPTNTSPPPPTNTVPPTNTSVIPTGTPTQGATVTPTEDDGEEGCTSTLSQAALAADTVITLADGNCFPSNGGVVQIGASTTRGYAERVGNQLFLVEPVGSGFPIGTLVTFLRGAGDDDDGCHIRANASNSNAWMLLIPAIGLLALRRKR